MFKNSFGFIVDLFKLIHRGQDMKMNARISNYGGKTQNPAMGSFTTSHFIYKCISESQDKTKEGQHMMKSPAIV